MTKKYEELIGELKEIVRKMEDGNTSLDEMITLYEQGMILVRQCEDRLAEAEVKITELGRES
ncbi:Exodeoxyribonuclease VII small subunit [Methanospirillum hungatei JF-1]|jgi:exodeoxyribonuclease VII small subunit|uniref:Exodeoxyribonuclease VII small subunit n=1 Tax=Methanospirillum hungatei JF-1 (strain ATCC 27890 / DSM 864 / NBRC 100397 / JF-1) TaxID=323259 RepID=Q2FTK4_METHJ|nr:exodeoxyribonuclease VII small subunit [Methanospirillum hungatei]ABD42695.1 Exodeoxyribonuclease VII small subunit [Methanospirillum hungatei JF-1]OQA56824.1 MAG: exodeoxyribonuclease VII small subunit [Euryarchaeota archaeon ADurb.Bin294]